MKRFHFYLYDNYNAAETRNPDADPRRVLTAEADGIVSAVIAAPAGGCPYPSLCGRHRVTPGEIANELYHVLFGQLNEALIARGFTAKPPYHAGEGRYLQSIALV